MHMFWWVIRVAGIWPLSYFLTVLHFYAFDSGVLNIKQPGKPLSALAMLILSIFMVGSPYIHRYLRERYVAHINRREELKSPGYCQTCGYDLRGTIAAKRYSCPECGAGVKWWSKK